MSALNNSKDSFLHIYDISGTFPARPCLALPCLASALLCFALLCSLPFRFQRRSPLVCLNRPNSGSSLHVAHSPFASGSPNSSGTPMSVASSESSLFSFQSCPGTCLQFCYSSQVSNERFKIPLNGLLASPLRWIAHGNVAKPKRNHKQARRRRRLLLNKALFLERKRN